MERAGTRPSNSRDLEPTLPVRTSLNLLQALSQFFNGQNGTDAQPASLGRAKDQALNSSAGLQPCQHHPESTSDGGKTCCRGRKSSVSVADSVSGTRAPRCCGRLHGTCGRAGHSAGSHASGIGRPLGRPSALSQPAMAGSGRSWLGARQTPVSLTELLIEADSKMNWTSLMSFFQRCYAACFRMRLRHL